MSSAPKQKGLLNVPNSDSNEYVLYNVANYNSEIIDSFPSILAKFVGVIIDYMRFISDRLVTKNKPYYRFIFERGLSTIIHVFSIIFYYTKNLDLTYYHSQKAFYFYVEFIEQISDDNVTFLQLSSRDATTFVYKKTIYDINSEFKRNMTEPKQHEMLILSYLEVYTYIYRNIANYIIQNKKFILDSKANYIEEHCKHIYDIHQHMYNAKFKKCSMDCVYIFTNLLVEREIEIDDFFVELETFLKRLVSRKKMDETSCAVLTQRIQQCHDDVQIIDYIFND